tara:strand:- start:275 stop:844 length:570 start_codon:yes stop_codon:yes gene_type:complete
MPFWALDKSMVDSNPLGHPMKVKFFSKKLTNALTATIDEISQMTMQKVSKRYPKWQTQEVLKTSKQGADGYIVDFGYQNDAAKELRRMSIGQKAHTVTGIYTLDVKAHKRRVKSKRGRDRIVNVKAHTKEYVGLKPVKINENWRIVNRLPEIRPKNPLITTTYESVRPNKFVQIFKKYLQNTIRNGRVL